MIEESISNSQKVHRKHKSTSIKKDSINQTQDSHKEFEEDDIVWAKIVGHPWWPALISEKRYPKYIIDEQGRSLKRKQMIYRVDFFGQPSHAFLDQSKIADYLTNRQYFIELAQKQPKKYNSDHFRASLKIADLMAKDPFEVNQPQSLANPQKLKASKEITKNQIHEQKTLKKQKDNNIKHKNDKTCDFKLKFSVTENHKKLSKFLLRLLRNKNKEKYSLKTLKQVIIRAFKTQKCISKIDDCKSQQISKWIKSLQGMDIEQIISKYHPSPTTNKTSYSYIYIDQLGQLTRMSQPLQECDFYIDL